MSKDHLTITPDDIRATEVDLIIEGPDSPNGKRLARQAAGIANVPLIQNLIRSGGTRGANEILKRLVNDPSLEHAVSIAISRKLES